MKWYTITAKADISEIWLYGEIGKDWFGEGIDSKEFIDELNAIKSPRIALHLSSPGGNVWTGAEIYNAIKRHPATVTTFIDGLCGSIASVVALSAEKVVMAENAQFIIHNPFGAVMGPAEDMRRVADALDKVRDTMVVTYAEKTKREDQEIMAWMDKETWFKATEAKDAGFVDEIGIKLDLAACAQFIPIMAAMGFKHIPQHFLEAKTIPSERDLERILRDAGCSVKQAKAILAKGYTGDLRDVDRTDSVLPADPVLRDVVPVKPARRDRTADLLIRAERMAPCSSQEGTQ